MFSIYSILTEPFLENQNNIQKQYVILFQHTQTKLFQTWITDLTVLYDNFCCVWFFFSLSLLPFILVLPVFDPHVLQCSGLYSGVWLLLLFFFLPYLVLFRCTLLCWFWFYILGITNWALQIKFQLNASSHSELLQQLDISSIGQPILVGFVYLFLYCDLYSNSALRLCLGRLPKHVHMYNIGLW